MVVMTRFAAALMLLPAVLVGAQGTPGKAPVPDAAARAKADALIRATFREDYEKARTDRAARKALAALLLEEGRKTREDAALRYAALAQAYDLAGQAGDAGTALQAITELAREFAIDARRMKADAFVAAARAPG